jgi:hypothetical protein
MTVDWSWPAASNLPSVIDKDDRGEVLMVHYGDPQIPQPHRIAPATLAELAATATGPPTPRAQEQILKLARRHERWSVDRLHARIRRKPGGRNDVSRAQIALILLRNGYTDRTVEPKRQRQRTGAR